MSKYDVLIVGGGMVGALAANLLLQQGFHVALIDRADGQITLPAPPDFDTRVSAISRHSQTLLQQADVWSLLQQERITPYHQMQVWDGLGTGKITFSCDDIYLDNLGYLVENCVLQQALLKGLEQYSHACFTRHFGVEVTNVTEQELRVCIEIDGDQTLSGEVVIAADGANSLLRNKLAMNTKEWDYGHDAIVATIEVDKPHQNTAWQSFGEEGILAFLPLPQYKERHFISIVWSVPPSHANELMALEPQQFCQRLNYAISEQFQVLALISKRQNIPLRQRHATHYTQSNLVLVGDAAHTIHPLAGQGANLGFADVGALVQTLTKARQRGEKLSNSRVLRRYQRARMHKNIEMAATMEMFKRLYEKQHPLLVCARNLGMTFVDKQTSLKNRLIKQAIGESI